jgi:hypothetical protein
MIIVRGKLVSPEVLQSYFACELTMCKGACCWEGEFGAPLDEEELDQIETVAPVVYPYLPRTGKALLDAEGPVTYYRERGFHGTTLAANGACVFMIWEDGSAKCSIERAYEDGRTGFRKPVSCHLYPIRIERDDQTGFETLRYDRWDICSPACQTGMRRHIKLLDFVREGLSRKYGEEFFDELQAISADY